MHTPKYYEQKHQTEWVSAGMTASWQYLVEFPATVVELRPTTIDGDPTDPESAYYWAATVPGIVRDSKGLAEWTKARDIGHLYEKRVRLYPFQVA